MKEHFVFRKSVHNTLTLGIKNDSDNIMFVNTGYTSWKNAISTI